MTAFIFDNIDNLNYHSNPTINDDIFVKNSQFILDKGSITSLANNHRASYKLIAKKYNTKQTIFEIDPYKNDYIILTKSIVNTNGVILTSDKKNFINGGCKCSNTKSAFTGKIQKIDTVITIAALWAEGIWHFPFEALVALKSIPDDILRKTKIHVSGISDYIIQWFNLINIDRSQLLTGNVYADTLYIPRMGNCGNPYFSQVCWLKSIVNKPIVNKPFQYIILIKRNNKRSLRNYYPLEELLKKYCKKADLELYIHDDNKLPTLTEQHQIFNKAKFVFAPHGAGGVNIISMKKNSWYIEFLSKEDINICYSRLAYLCGINYKGILMKRYTIDLVKIETTLKDLITASEETGGDD